MFFLGFPQINVSAPKKAPVAEPADAPQPTMFDAIASSVILMAAFIGLGVFFSIMGGATGALVLGVFVVVGLIMSISMIASASKGKPAKMPQTPPAPYVARLDGGYTGHRYTTKKTGPRDWVQR